MYIYCLNVFIYRVSSTLNNDHKNYGKKNMFDGNEETCWNSSEVKIFLEVLLILIS